MCAVCRRSGGPFILCMMTAAAGILLGLLFPSGFLVFVLCVLLILLGVLMLV